MSIIQDKLAELRYIKRKNLHEEAKVIGNYFRDIIRSFGIDCRYFKLKTNYPTEFTDNLSQNNLIMHAYGHEPDPDFSISANMITYMEVENDIFNLNKYGVIPDMTVNFYFDATDFAAALATKLGRLKEFNVQEQSISASFALSDVGNLSLSSSFECDILSGIYSIDFDSYEYGLSANGNNIISCNVLNQSDAAWFFPVNDDIYKSFYYIVYENAKENVQLNFRFNIMNSSGDTAISADGETLAELLSGMSPTEKYTIVGTLYGTALFHDLKTVSKYRENIVPNVGDIVTIDFPDEHNREQYQITESIDKNLSRDGQNPLLHKYYWKCTAKRYVNDHESFPEPNFANKQLDEKLDIINQAAVDVGTNVEVYPENQDDFYGGYGKDTNFKDITEATLDVDSGLQGSELNIMKFGNGTQLMTDGFSLYFKQNNGVTRTIIGSEYSEKVNNVETLRFIKATDNIIVFNNIAGETFNLTDNNELVSEENLKLCLDSLVNIATFTNGATNLNFTQNNFYKFTNCNTILFATDKTLMYRLGKSGEFKEFNFAN